MLLFDHPEIPAEEAAQSFIIIFNSLFCLHFYNLYTVAWTDLSYSRDEHITYAIANIS